MTTRKRTSRVGAGEPAVRRAPSNSTREVALSRDEIVRVAIGLIDRDGLPAFSTRGLASELDISGPALYWHFRNREELLQACASDVLGRVDVGRPGADERWPDAVRRLLRSLWANACEHPWLLDVLAGRPLHTPEGDRLLHALLLVLRRAGFPPDDAVDNARVLLWSTFGFIRSTAATQARTGASGPSVVLELGVLDERVAADLADCLPRLRVLEVDELYERALDTLIAGIGAPPRR